MKRIWPVVLGLVAWLTSQDAGGKVWTQPLMLEASAAPGQIVSEELLAAPVTPEVIEGEEIVFAEVRFNDALASGTEIEIWPAGSDSAAVDSTFGRNLWITDERTGSLVRFDVTRIVRAWEAGDLPNHGFVIRVVGQGGGEGDAPAAFSSPSGMVLRYHTGPTPEVFEGRGRRVRDKDGRRVEKQE